MFFKAPWSSVVLSSGNMSCVWWILKAPKNLILYCFDFFNTCHVNVCVVDVEMTEVGVRSQ